MNKHRVMQKTFMLHANEIYEPQRQKTYLQTCAPSEYSDHITKTRVFKYIENITTTKWKLSD